MIISSLLGKQNVSKTFSSDYYLSPANDGSFQIYSGGSKRIDWTYTHKFFVFVFMEQLPTGITAMRTAGVSDGGYSSFTFSNTNNDYYGITTGNGNTSEIAITFNGILSGSYTPSKMIIIDLTSLGLDTLTAQQFYGKYYPIFDLLASGGSYDTDSMPFMLSESVSVNSKDTDIIADITRGKILWEKPIMMSSLLGKQNVSANVSELYSNFYIRPLTNGSFASDSGTYKNVDLINGHKYLCTIAFDDLFANCFSERLSLRYGSTYPTILSNYEINNLSVSVIEVTETINTCLFYRTLDYLKSTIGVLYAFYIDLTAYGLDNLTAQQFYDNFNQYFSQLANGNEVMVKYSKYGIKKIKDCGTWQYNSSASKFTSYITGRKVYAENENVISYMLAESGLTIYPKATYQSQITENYIFLFNYANTNVWVTDNTLNGDVQAFLNKYGEYYILYEKP